MKYEKVRLFTRVAAATAVALICVANPTAVQAQSSELKADIPFDFYIGGRSFPAGTYTVRLTAGSAIQVQGQSGNNSMIAMSLPISNDDRIPDSRLVFNQYGNDHFLTEVRWRGYNLGRGLIKSSRELELAKNSVETRRTVAASKAP